MSEFNVKGKELLGKIEELIHQGNIRRIIIKDGAGKTFMEIPLTIGVIGTAAAPVFVAVGAIAGLVANFRIEVIKTDDQKSEEAIIVEDKSEN
ncbi:MAG: DUF4342 domain-containing protein [Melioribacteraceae bacterium]|nr:DUF4342 domain-containing protein [Melioribacteraceae bacterium]MCF8263719.1 DUF4342 domain-containing protein [Melioribacteraceae bacterium]MCF8414001.1 DUF4342 domain-containing protein [Melioribacteraceae bacterium]MCF8431744.1 DUF4342 domain-containing protein [Melioribacteraceae bacterium]